MEIQREHLIFLAKSNLDFFKIVGILQIYHSLFDKSINIEEDKAILKHRHAGC